MRTEAQHIILEIWDTEYINDLEYLKSVIINSVNAGNFSMVDEVEHKFNPYGYSYVVLLAESHISLHSFPEHNYIAIDIYGCGEKGDVHKSAKYIIEQLKPKKYTGLVIERGNKSEEIMHAYFII